ncbi:MAG: PEP-CTERM sorting domain-containing protein [Thermoguttaceae bacterium]|jgi:hypothetical protein
MFEKTMVRGLISVAAVATSGVVKLFYGLLFLAVLPLVVIIASPPTAQAETIYNLINFPQYQNGWNFPGGWNMSGTITTDGNMGLLTTSDIKAWSWTATNGTYTYSANSSQSGTSCSTWGSNGVFATSSYLALPLSTGANYGINLVSTIPPPSPYTLGNLNYQLGDSAMANYVCDALYWYNFSYTPVAPWWTDGISAGSNGVSTPIGNAWEFANGGTATPEPSTLTLLVSALLGLAVVYLRRRETKV